MLLRSEDSKEIVSKVVEKKVILSMYFKMY